MLNNNYPNNSYLTTKNPNLFYKNAFISNRKELYFWKLILFFLSFSITAGLAVEPTIGLIYRHLSPFYFSAIFFSIILIANKNHDFSSGKFPAWLFIALIISLYMAAMLLISQIWIDGLADTSRWAYIFFVISSIGIFKPDLLSQRTALFGVLTGSLYTGFWILSKSNWDFFNPNAMLISIDRNYAGAIYLSGLLASIFLISTTPFKKKGAVIFPTLCIPFLIFWIISTYSRSILLIAMVSIIIFLFYKSKNVRLNILLIGVLIVSYLIISAATNISDRLLLSRIDDPDSFSEGRISIWRGVLDGLPSTNYFGAGTSNLGLVLTNSPTYSSSIYGKFISPYRTAAHSMFLKLLGENGIIGGALFLIFTIGMVLFGWKKRNVDIFPLIGALFCFILGLFFDYMFAPWVLLAIFFGPYICENSQLT